MHVSFLVSRYPRTAGVVGMGGAHHLLRRNLSLLVLLGGEGRAGHDRGAGHGGRAEGGPSEGAEEACGVHRGLCKGCGSARSSGASIGKWRVLAGESAYRVGVRGPVKMDCDGCRRGSWSVVWEKLSVIAVGGSSGGGWIM